MNKKGGVMDKKEGGSKVTYLALGELGLGTKAYDPLAMDGLALFLELNGYAGNLDAVILNGGLLPFKPEYYGKGTAQDMRFLGIDPNKKPDDRVNQILSSNIDDKDKEYIKNHVAQKITTTTEAADFSRREMEKLLPLLKGAQIHYIPGDEDTKHIESLEEILLNDYLKSKDRKKEFESRVNELTETIEQEKRKLTIANIEHNWMNSLKVSLKAKTSVEISTVVNDYLERKAEELSSLDDEVAEIIQGHLKSVKESKDLVNKLNQLDSEMKEYKSDIKKKSSELKDLKLTLNAIEREKEAAGFFRATKRRQIDAQEEEILFRQAKKNHNTTLYSIVNNEDGFHVHSNFETSLQINGLDFLLYHNINFRSNNTGKNALQKQKITNHQRNKEGLPVADIIISTHGGGGFRFQTELKYSEKTAHGEVRETPELAMYIHLPVFHSREEIGEYKRKNIRNWSTKRYDEGCFGSGAVLHTRTEDGRDILEFVSVDQLISLGPLKKEYDQLTASLNKKKLSKKAKRQIQQDLAILEDKVKLSLEKAEIFSDSHLGCPNMPGRPSNYQNIDAAKSYQKKSGLPKYLILNGDILHGVIGAFGSNEEYFAEVPKIIESLEEKIKTNPDLKPEQKLDELQKLAREQRAAVPITSISKQNEELKRRFLPYVEEVLENGGKLVIVSGNHYGGSRTTYFDEARDIANMIPTKYFESGQVAVFEGLGMKNGSGETDLGDKRLFCSHKLTKSSDEVVGAMYHVLKANKKADLVVLGHWHSPGGGFADGSYFVSAASMQGWHPYLDAVQVPPGPRGIINFFFDQKKQYGKWELVLDPTLEKEMK
ncbi:MAG: hypothetical protein AABX39_04990 [Nanoarchaeota archaeon]